MGQRTRLRSAAFATALLMCIGLAATVTWSSWCSPDSPPCGSIVPTEPIIAQLSEIPVVVGAALRDTGSVSPDHADVPQLGSSHTDDDEEISIAWTTAPSMQANDRERSAGAPSLDVAGSTAVPEQAKAATVGVVQNPAGSTSADHTVLPTQGSTEGGSSALNGQSQPGAATQPGAASQSTATGTPGTTSQLSGSHASGDPISPTAHGDLERTVTAAPGAPSAPVAQGENCPPGSPSCVPPSATPAPETPGSAPLPSSSSPQTEIPPLHNGTYLDPLSTLFFVNGTNGGNMNSTAAALPPKNVFFIKLSTQNTTLDPDELCGLESALRAFGSDHRVYLLTTDDFNETSLRGIESDVVARVNILRWPAYIAAWRAAGTLPHMLQWYDQGRWRYGYALNNLSNAFRLVLLYNHGGMYFDLDIVHLKPPAVQSEFLTYQEGRKLLNNAAMRLSPESPLLVNVTAEFVINFNGTHWGHNGPNRLSASYHAFCPKAVWCARIHMMRWLSYYPLAYYHRRRLYINRPELKKSFTDETFGVHLWKATYLGGNVTLAEPDSMFHQLTQRRCPFCLRTFGLPGLTPTSGNGTQEAPRALDGPTTIPDRLADRMVLPSGT